VELGAALQGGISAKQGVQGGEALAPSWQVSQLLPWHRASPLRSRTQKWHKCTTAGHRKQI